MVDDNHGKKQISRREFLVGSGAVMAAVALAGCTSKNTQSSATPTTNNPTTTGAIKKGGTLKIAVAPVATLGWPVGIMGQGQGVNQGVFETLLRSDSQGKIHPWLAESYTVGDDLKSMTLKLRKGVKFHDGSDFNATVVKWNIEQYMAANSVKNLKSVDVVDPYTVRVNFTKWDNTLLLTFADSSFEVYMLSKASYDAKGKQWMTMNPVGTGPFKALSFKTDVGFKAARNPAYWGKDAQGNQLPYLDGLDYTFISDPVTMRMSLQAKQMDQSTLRLSDSDMTKLGVNFHSKVSGNEYLVPDTANPDSPWANQKFREAVEYAIDKEAIASAFGYGYLHAPYQLPPRDSLAYNPNFTLARKYDLAKAKQLLSESGLTLPVQTTLIVSQVEMKDRALAVQATLAKIGVNVKLDFPDVGRWITYIMGRWPKNSALYTPYPAVDPTYALGLQFIMNNISASWSKPPELVAAAQAAFATPSIDEAKIRAATDIITSDALLIPVKESVTCQGDWPYVHYQYEMRGGANMWNTESAWMDK